MRNQNNRKIFNLLFSGILFPLLMHAQVAQWSFNNVVTGTGSANTTASSVVLGSAISTGAFNGGTVYFGEDGWPAGGLDLNAYLEFTVSPVASHTLTISQILFNIRRSTTGNSGSGPQNWALRSSLDGFASDISNGTLSLVSTPAIPVTFTSAFANLATAVTFRLYGYNAVVTANGGLNRFVYDNISVSGSATTLPLVFESFKVTAGKNTALLSWNLAGEGNVAEMNAERSSDGHTFESISRIPVDPSNAATHYTYTDNLLNPAGIYYYRIQMVSADGKISYSPVQQAGFADTDSFSIQALNSGAASDIRFRITIQQAGDYQFVLYDMNGMKVTVKTLNLSAGTQTLSMDKVRNKSGIYILTAGHGDQQRVSKIAVQ
jgi:hypothetical protein